MRHHQIVNEFRKFFEKLEKLRVCTMETFNPKEATIAMKDGRKRHVYVAHKPDLIINLGCTKKDRLVFEYVNKKESYLRDLRGIINLSTLMEARMFVMVINDNVHKQFQLVGINSEKIARMPLSIVLKEINEMKKARKPTFPSILSTL